MNGIRENQKSESVQNASQHTGIGQKRCSKCGEVKPVDCFYKDPKSMSGLRSWCKECARADKRKWHYVNKDKRKQQFDDWKEKNKESFAEYKKEWAKANPEKVTMYNQKWRGKNKEKVQENKKRYWQKIKSLSGEKAKRWRERRNKNKAVANHKRRASKYKNGGKHTAKDIDSIFLHQGGLCNFCGVKLIRYNKKQYHIDHIIPLARGGSNNPENIQLLCPSCNLSKSNKDPIQWARENGRLF